MESGYLLLIQLIEAELLAFQPLAELGHDP
jgi:hypothetical protein